MKISSAMSGVDFKQKPTAVKTMFTEKLTKDELKGLKEQISQNVNAYTFKSLRAQTEAIKPQNQFAKDYQDFQTFLSDVGYKGKLIADLSKAEAAALVKEDGIFGIKQTSERIANFVINGAGGNESMMRAGREGMLQGFKDAQTMWGSKLPDISQQTMAKAIEMVDMAMNDLGFSILNKEA